MRVLRWGCQREAVLEEKRDCRGRWARVPARPAAVTQDDFRWNHPASPSLTEWSWSAVLLRGGVWQSRDWVRRSGEPSPMSQPEAGHQLRFWRALRAKARFPVQKPRGAESKALRQHGKGGGTQGGKPRGTEKPGALTGNTTETGPVYSSWLVDNSA